MDVRSRSFLFQLALVQTLSREARQAFWSPENQNRHARFDRGRLVEDHDVGLMSYSIFADYTAECIIVTFPGTQTRQQVDIYSTLRKDVMPWTTNMLAHKGFLHLYMTVREALKKALGAVLHEGYGLIFNGWSLGGAMCRLAVWDFLATPNLYHPFFLGLWASRRRQGMERILVTSWGAPKCFSRLSASTYTSQFLSSHVEDYRFEVEGDPVARLPFEWFDFFHVGTRVLVPNWMMDEADGWLKSWQARHFGYAQNTFLMFAV